jgi:hypothetical protein
MKRGFALFLLAVSVACSKNEQSGPDATAPDGGPWACPPNPPELGAPCPPPLACEYTSAKTCGSYFACIGENELSYRWTAMVRECSTPTPCSYYTEAGATCSTSSGPCTMDGKSCVCNACINEAGAYVSTWNCESYGPSPGCPADPPRFGSACENEGLTCDYRDCKGTGTGLGPPARCLAGLWIADESVQCNADPGPGTCP